MTAPNPRHVTTEQQALTPLRAALRDHGVVTVPGPLAAALRARA